MDFLKHISTPFGTTESAPLLTKLKLTKGRITGGFLYFPYGSAGYLHVMAKIGIHQILPSNTGENYSGDDSVLPISLKINLVNPPYEIDCITWNESTSINHALTICFFLDPIINGPYDLAKLQEIASNV